MYEVSEEINEYMSHEDFVKLINGSIISEYEIDFIEV